MVYSTLEIRSAKVSGSIPFEHPSQSRPTPTESSHAKNVYSEKSLNKNAHQLAHAMLTTLKGIVPQQHTPTGGSARGLLCSNHKEEGIVSWPRPRQPKSMIF